MSRIRPLRAGVEAGEQRALADDDVAAVDAGRLEAGEVEHLVLDAGDAPALGVEICRRRSTPSGRAAVAW